MTTTNTEPDNTMIQATVQQWLNSSEEGIQKVIIPCPRKGADIQIGFVNYDDKSRMFQIREDFYGNTYDMHADRIRSSDGLLDFLFQIHSKPWITGQHLKDFLDCLTCWTYRETEQFPQIFFDVACAMNRKPVETPPE